MIKNIANRFLKKLKNHLDNFEISNAQPIGEFDNDSKWVNAMFLRLLSNNKLWNKPQYIWGALQSAALAKSLNYKSISFIEFGVAAGNGLKVMDQLAIIIAKELDIKIEVYGFDTGKGMPAPEDHRDLPNLFMDGEYNMNFEKLQSELKQSKLNIGLLTNTLPEFVKKDIAPIAFISFDLDYYSSTKTAFEIFNSKIENKLPRVMLYFDDIFIRSYCEFNGPTLAINEFNNANDNRKIGKINGLRYFLPINKNWAWPEAMFLLHEFKHVDYNKRELGEVIHG